MLSDPSYPNLRQQMEQDLKRRLAVSIDARVDDVTVHASGAGELRLRDRPGKPGRGPEESGIAGQTLLFFDSCPPDVWNLAGRDIWGSDHSIMLGEVKIAEREGYTRIRFVVSSIAEALGEKPVVGGLARPGQSG